MKAPKKEPPPGPKASLKTPPKEKKAPGKIAKKAPFYIVGMGGSAGGLEAFERFFDNLPPDTGMAFVLVPHQDPTHKGMMPELLQRHTRMKIFPVEDGMKVRPDQVYIIPPNKDMSIFHGTLQLLEPSTPRGLRMPIDFFFRHLAEDQGEKAIGIILSGMGTDGTLGLKAIKEKMGIAMVQDLKSAKYDGMPRSAMDTGLVDFVAPAEELPTKMIGYVKHSLRVSREGPVLEEKASSGLQKIFVLLRAHTGHDFSFYKKNTLYRRIERRTSVHQISSLPQYIRYLQTNPQELDFLFRELLIGVTSFFRDPEAFAAVQEKAAPHLLKARGRGDTLRIWMPGCSTGEEAYSMAILLRESLEKLKPRDILKIQIFATDIDKEALEKARQGTYPSNIAADVSPERLQRFFIKEDTAYRVRKEIREMLVFAPQNILMDPPFTKLDMICCRNLLIYLTPELQKKVLPLFHYSLHPGGILFLGSAETIGVFGDLFSPLDTKWKIFKRKESGPRTVGRVDLPPSLLSPEVPRTSGPRRVPENMETEIPDLAQKILLDNFAPPAVIINEKGDILYIHGRTGKYLEPSAGKANMNIFSMAREGFRMELGSAIRKAAGQKKEIALKGLQVKTNGGYQAIHLLVRPIRQPEGRQGLLLVVFSEAENLPQPPGAGKTRPAAPAKPGTRVAGLEKELKYTKELLQTTVEEMETSQEELKSSNEELQSTNEELQSNNEELSTSKEEMQSLNEELATLNEELQVKIDELSQSNNDMKNLLNGTDIATIFLDIHLRIKRFTSPATQVFNLIQADLGRPIAHLAPNLKYENWVRDVEEVLKTLVSKEAQIQSKDGRWYLMRILPYRTLDNVIDGVVITFTDITPLRQLEESLRQIEARLQEERNFAESIVATVREPMLVLDSELRVASANRSFYRAFQVTPGETEKRLLYELGNGQWDIPTLRHLLEEVLPQSTEFQDFQVETEFPKVGHKKMLLNARRVYREDGRSKLILLAMEDVTERNLQFPAE